ncbi:MAG: hypothetical protein CMH57_10735, partial [Myxococcales bacterium]|nr:hypothetical protein [Myxococcales bacterium]
MCVDGMCVPDPCPEDQCDEGASRCTEGGDVETCQEGEDGCFAFAVGEECADGEICVEADGEASCEFDCPEACTPDAQRCGEDGDVETCELDSNGCFTFGVSTACTDAEICVEADGAATCEERCPDECQSGTSRCTEDGDVETCQEGEDGCFAFAMATDCTDRQSCSEADGVAQCVDNCPGECELDATRCNMDGDVETCQEGGDGCYVFELTEDCQGGLVCDDMDGSAACEVDCGVECSAGTTRCSEGGDVESCQEGPDGCLIFALDTACGGLQSCVDDGLGATCECADECEAPNTTRCNADGDVVTCEADADGCLVLNLTEDCTEGEVCNDQDAMAQCVVDCGVECMPNDTRCSAAGDVETCQEDVRGCFAFTLTEECSDTSTCDDMMGPAQCVVDCGVECADGETRCSEGGDVESCQENNDGCFVFALDTECTGRTSCDDSGEVTECACDDACEALDATSCNGSEVAVCVQDEDGCLYPEFAEDCSEAGRLCEEGAEGAFCGALASGDDCGNPARIDDETTLAGGSFAADFTDAFVLTDASCQEPGGDAREAVFEVIVPAGSAVQIAELGEVEATFSIQDSCGATEACVFAARDDQAITATAPPAEELVFTLIVSVPEELAGGAYDLRFRYSQNEICDNNEDEDFDGLVDCFDPECNGVGDCPLIEGARGVYEYFDQEPIDVEETIIVFTPDLGIAAGYTYEATSDNVLPVQPGSGTVSLPAQFTTPDDTIVLDLGGATFTYFGVPYTELYINANGNITFGDLDTTEPSADGLTLFNLPRVAPLMAALDPTQGSVTVDIFDAEIVVTWLDVPGVGLMEPNTFQVVLNQDGTVTFAYGKLDPDLQEAVVGLGDGDPLSSLFFPEESDLVGGGGGFVCEEAPVVTAGFVAEGANFFNDFSNVLEFNDASCDVIGASPTAPDAVFAIDLELDDVLYVREEGGVDSVLRLQAECGDRGFCPAAEDLGVDESGGFTVRALASTRVFVVVSSYDADPGEATDYRIVIDVGGPEICDAAGDEDFDGLEDCDDPDCSGVGECPSLAARGIFEYFDDSPVDLAGTSIAFTPNVNAPQGYTYEVTEGLETLPFTPGGGTFSSFPLNFQVVDPVPFNFGGQAVPFYGQLFTDIYVSSNGTVTFGAPATGTPANEGFNLFNLPQIAALHTALDPASGAATVDIYDAFATFSWVGFSRPGVDEELTFQIVWSQATGEVSLHYLTTGSGVLDAIAGLSNGVTTPPLPPEVDFLDTAPPAERAFGIDEFFGAQNVYDLSGVSLIFVPDFTAPEGYVWFPNPGIPEFIEQPGSSPATQQIELGDEESFFFSLTQMGSFPFFGVPYTDVYISSNGYLTFGEEFQVFEVTLNNFYAVPLMGMLADLDPGAGGTITIDPYADRLVVSFDGVPFWGDDYPNKFQYTLFVDGSFILHFIDVSPGPSLTQVGIGDGDPDSTGIAPLGYDLSSGPTTALSINEVVYDNPSTDGAEFIELYGQPGASLEGHTLVHYNGSNGAIIWEIDLTGLALNSSGFLVIGDLGVANLGVDWATLGRSGGDTSDLQNGEESLVLYTGWDSELNTGTPVDAVGW